MVSLALAHMFLNQYQHYTTQTSGNEYLPNGKQVLFACIHSSKVTLLQIIDFFPLYMLRAKHFSKCTDQTLRLELCGYLPLWKLADIVIKDECVCCIVNTSWKIISLTHTDRHSFDNLPTYLCQQRKLHKWKSSTISHSCQLYAMCLLVNQHLMNSTKRQVA